VTALVFVDTNVFVYARDANEPMKQPLAAHWLERLWSEGTGRTSVQVVNEYYWNLTHKIRPALLPDDAWVRVRRLFNWNPLPVDTELAARAHEIERRWRLSWWDSLIVAAAQGQNCSLLLTEDLQDRAVYGGVTLRNPFTLGVSEGMAEYAAAPVIARRYRPRGRPKRQRATAG
jgi:predicted nucleic acid-binding protein